MNLIQNGLIHDGIHLRFWGSLLSKAWQSRPSSLFENAHLLRRRRDHGNPLQGLLFVQKSFSFPLLDGLGNGLGPQVMKPIGFLNGFLELLHI